MCKIRKTTKFCTALKVWANILRPKPKTANAVRNSQISPSSKRDSSHDTLNGFHLSQGEANASTNRTVRREITPANQNRKAK
ncbi:hypothetical protein ACIRXL_11640 [Avibacterium paragallinarum]|uniref:hypothetical protein n=1 Tax=Avibacterium paragallinarum TaxID=728 RepID=UPI00397DCDB1